MRRKFLPFVLTCALLLNSSMAFAADVNETVEGDALTTVSETQEEVAAPAEEEQEVVTEEVKEESTPVVLEGGDTTPAPITITDFGKAYEALEGVGAAVSGTDTVKAAKDGSAVVLDVRSTVNYKKAHLDGSINVPVFNDDGSVISTSEDDTAKAFTEYVTAHKAELDGKDIYIICNSGARGAQAATVLLVGADYSVGKLHTVTNGAKDLQLRYGMLNTDGNPVTGEEAVKAIGSKDIAILDIRTAEDYAIRHLKGVISAPVFGSDLAATDSSEVAQSFLAKVKDNKDLANKEIYVSAILETRVQKLLLYY